MNMILKQHTVKRTALLLALLLALSLAACGGKDSAAPAGTDGAAAGTQAPQEGDAPQAAPAEDAPAANDTANDGYEKFSRLAIGMTEDEVNAILGEPAKVDKAYYYYNIMVNGEELQIEVWINTVSGIVTYFNGDFYKDSVLAAFADAGTDLSKAGELKAGEDDTGTLETYEACAQAFGTPGYLITADEDGTTRYLWADANEGHMCVTFRADGSIKSYQGFC